MKKLSALAFVFVAGVASIASATHHSPLYEATDRYRDAVVHFERHAIQSRIFDRYDLRLVDDLEDSTSRLRSASRHVHRSADYDYRFASALSDINKLQARVQQAISAEERYHAYAELSQCWHAVVCAYSTVINEARWLPGREPVHPQEIYYRPPVHNAPTIMPRVETPRPSTPVIVVPPQQVIPQRRSVSYPSSAQNHHAAMQAKIGAMLQRR